MTKRIDSKLEESFNVFSVRTTQKVTFEAGFKVVFANTGIGECIDPRNYDIGLILPSEIDLEEGDQIEIKVVKSNSLKKGGETKNG